MARWWVVPVVGLALLAAAEPASAHALAGIEAPEIRFRQKTEEAPGTSLRALRGRAVLLFFFKCHDAFCVEQAGRITEAYKRFAPEGMVVLGLSEDNIGEITAFLGRNGCLFPGAVDAGFKGLAGFGAISAPTAVLVGPVYSWQPSGLQKLQGEEGRYGFVADDGSAFLFSNNDGSIRELFTKIESQTNSPAN